MTFGLRPNLQSFAWQNSLAGCLGYNQACKLFCKKLSEKTPTLLVGVFFTD